MGNAVWFCLVPLALLVGLYAGLAFYLHRMVD